MITLVPIKPEYAELWLKWRGEPNMMRYNPITEISLENLRFYLEAISSDLSDLNAAHEFRFFIQFQEQLVGTICLKNINPEMLFCEIGYGIGEEFQGRGFGLSAVKLLIEKVFNETPMRRIAAYVSCHNVASQKILEKSGFLKEGTCRQHFIINGQPTDEFLYAILRSDWQKISAKI